MSFKTLIKKFIIWAMNDNIERNISKGQPVLSRESVTSLDFDSSNSIRLTIHRAQGGLVVEFRTYDSRTDTTKQHLYIINENDNFGDELSQIVTRQILTK